MDNTLNYLYFVEDLPRLEIIKLYRPDLLTIKLPQLIKILFYGADTTLQFIIDNCTKQLESILEKSNPLGLSVLDGTYDKIDIYEDFWNVWDRYNYYAWLSNKVERKPLRYHEKTIQLLLKFTENKYPHIQFTPEIVKQWLQKIEFLNENSVKRHNSDDEQLLKYTWSKELLLKFLNNLQK
jgi:hypothetical protein